MPSLGPGVPVEIKSATAYKALLAESPLSCVLLVCFGVTCLLEDQKWGIRKLTPLALTGALGLGGVGCAFSHRSSPQPPSASQIPCRTPHERLFHSLRSGRFLLMDTLLWVSTASSVI